MRTETEKFLHINYAHRGLHNISEGVPENSVEAFRLAANSGYGIELDVQHTRDGYVVVFHDDTLKRMCGIDVRVDEFDYKELQEFSLFGTACKIPLFSDVLDIIGDNTPVIIELKTGKRNEELCRKTYEIMKNHKGIYCIESFNPFIVKWFYKNAPQIVRGQLASIMEDYLPGQNKITAFLLSRCMFCFLAKPDFIAYKNTVRPKRILRKRKHGIALFAWTSREPLIDQKSNDAVIFEGYRPETNY